MFWEPSNLTASCPACNYSDGASIAAAMMRAEFDEKPFGVAGEMVVSNPPPQSEPVPRWTPPPPPWSEHYTGDEPELGAEPEPEDEPEERGSEG